MKPRIKAPVVSLRILPSAMTVAAICLGLTSVKMAPKADVRAGVFVPATKNLTSVTLLSSAVNRRCGLNVAKLLE